MPERFRMQWDLARGVSESDWEKAGLPKDFRAHDLRHTFASVLASSGEIDIFTLQKLLGHKTTQMTNRYTHLMDRSLHRGTEVIDRVLGNGD